MEDIELKGNSFKQKALENEENTEEQKEPIIKGAVKQKKKPAGKQFLENFVNEDGHTIKNHVLFDIIVPMLKDMISNGFQAAIDMLLYGGNSERGNRVASSGRRVISTGGNTNYNAISNTKKRYSEGRVQSCDDIFFEERADAVRVLDELTEQLDKFGAVSAWDLYDAAGLTCDYTLKNWGWYDLNSATVSRTRDGDYIINLPKMLVIK